MNSLIRSGMAAVFLLGLALNASAQNFGYVSMDAVLAEIPQIKQADANLEALQKQLQERGTDMVQALQRDVQDLQTRAQNGELTPAQQQQEAARLEKEQEKIQNYEQEMVTTIQERRAELLEPILKRVEDAIKDVAREAGYSTIFDRQMILYGEEGNDVTLLVKAKLGL